MPGPTTGAMSENHAKTISIGLQCHRNNCHRHDRAVSFPLQLTHKHVTLQSCPQKLWSGKLSQTWPRVRKGRTWGHVFRLGKSLRRPSANQQQKPQERVIRMRLRCGIVPALLLWAQEPLVMAEATSHDLTCAVMVPCWGYHVLRGMGTVRPSTITRCRQ